MIQKELSNEEVDVIKKDVDVARARIGDVSGYPEIKKDLTQTLDAMDNLIFTLRHTEQERDTMKESMQSFVEHHEAETRGLESKLKESQAEAGRLEGCWKATAKREQNLTAKVTAYETAIVETTRRAGIALDALKKASSGK